MILVYFKEPAISLVMGGELDEIKVKELMKAGLGPVIRMEDPDGRTQLLFPSKDVDITYMKEITKKEYEEMKEKEEKRKKEIEAKGGMGKIVDPSMMVPGRGRGRG